MKRMDAWMFAGVCLSGLLAPVTLSAQTETQTQAQGVSHQAVPPATGKGLQPAIDALYRQAGAATDVDQLLQLQQTCRRLREKLPNDETGTYVRRLLAWLHNRTGELLTQQAQQLAQANDESGSTRVEQQAIEQFTTSIDLEPNARAFHNRGVSLAATGKFDEAVQDFSRCLDHDPNYTNALFNRAELNLELGQYQAAEADYAAVLLANPNDVDALMGRGHTRFYLGKFEDSLLDFDDAIRSDPKRAIAYADRADLYAYLGRWEPAARDYRMAIRLDNNLGRAYQCAAWVMATCPDEKFRDENLAVRAAERAIELDGRADYRYLDTLAAAQANAKRFQEAQKSVQMAMQAAPQDVVPELQQRLALYQSRRPYRDVPR